MKPVISNNFNLLISLLAIFLNYQTYHHLFPNVSHFHFLNIRDDIDRVISRYSHVQTQELSVVIKNYYRYILNNSFDQVNTRKKSRINRLGKRQFLNTGG